MAGTGVGADGYGAGPVPAPRLVRQRRVRRGWLAAGVLLVALSALGSAALFRAVGPAQEYLALADDVPVGALVTTSDLIVVRLNHPPGLSLVSAADADLVVGRYAAVPLVAGTLVSRAQLTTQPVPGPGEQLVAVPLSRNQLPGGVLRAGDPVLLVATDGRAVGQRGQEPPRTFDARVHLVRPAEGRGGDVVVSLLVATGDGAVVANLAASGRMAVVRVPEVGR
jgi:hypothetical protein